jgi:multiple sugar transport system ATP-binding protein
MVAVSLSGLTKVYATGAVAVDGLDLEVNDGEFVVLVGPSGCGKTTALRMVAGLESVTSGTIRFGGQVVNDVSPRHRDVAMVFQNYALYPHLSVRENIAFALENKNVPRAERQRRVLAAAMTTGLSDLLSRKPRHLSGGQRQRVAMARAIVREPAVFLMDEPLSSLDAKLRVQMRSEVVRVHRSVGVATLYVTHDQTEAMTMGDRVAVLRDGVLQQYDTPRALYWHPANLFVAAFIGSPEMNLYEAAVEPSGSLVLGSQRLPLPPRPESGLAGYADRKIIVGIRPEDLVPAAGNEASLTADVRLVELLGSEQHVHFRIDATSAGTGRAVSGIPGGAAPNGVARTGPRVGLRAGDRVRFAVEETALHFFDADTGAAIGQLAGDARRAAPEYS